MNSVERFLRDVNQTYLEVLTTGYHGFRPKLGTMVNIAGPALGVEYLRKGLLQGRLDTAVSAQTSTRGYQKYEAEAAFPKLVKGRISAEFFAVHRNYPSMHYYGSGPDRSKELRTNYRLEDTSTDAILALQALPGLKIGGSAGYVWTNVGSGG
ncbi:MAG: hypothetical protein SFV54_15405 [Bryobacteraceae bacterium]|nr:hypothetical protein [Bryobacteraceae bacterium]